MKVYKAVETSESRDVETSEIEKGLSIPELEAQPSSYEIEERASGRETDGKYERDEDDDIDSEPILGVGEIPDKYITNEARIQLLRSSLKRSTPTKEDLRLDLLHKASKLFIAGEIEGTFQEHLAVAMYNEKKNALKRLGGRRRREMKQIRKNIALRANLRKTNDEKTVKKEARLA